MAAHFKTQDERTTNRVPNSSMSSGCGLVLMAEAMVARSDRAAIILRTAVAYVTGLRVTMTALLRDRVEEHDWQEAMASGNPCGLQLGFQWQGLPAPRLYPATTSVYSTNPARSLIIAVGSGPYYEIAHWLAPLRDRGGALEMHVSWQQLGIATAVTGISIPRKAAVAEASQPLWD